MKRGALGSTVAQDAHNVVVVGVSDAGIVELKAADPVDEAAPHARLMDEAIALARAGMRKHGGGLSRIEAVGSLEPRSS